MNPYAAAVPSSIGDSCGKVRHPRIPSHNQLSQSARHTRPFPTLCTRAILFNWTQRYIIRPARATDDAEPDAREHTPVRTCERWRTINLRRHDGARYLHLIAKAHLFTRGESLGMFRRSKRKTFNKGRRHASLEKAAGRIELG